MITKVLLLDIDGPMIPRRASWLAGQTYRSTKFDPVAVGLLLSVLEKTGAKLVISSTWGKVYTREENELSLENNGISKTLLHDDWVTPRNSKLETRAAEILAWLKQHPEITNYAVLDDEAVALPKNKLKNLVKVTFSDGLLLQHYHQLLNILKPLPDEI